ncbi:ABC transporter permease [Arcobacter sp. FWKO B]|uniref:ABC transporter permease n=1 Tax=Arcobacter sp. FWKO B TaxID=2593672 RepID=UPI0018A3D084|nr:ABC transporter permease [Arcobacter sp. FWKO B]QOG12855.1 ABC transporter permease [Arcobacter sp. FWKO B]
MNKKLINYIVLKYLRFDKTNPFISISGILAFFGVAIGIMVLILTMAIMNGTQKEFEKKLFTMNYPLTIYPKIENSVTIDLLNQLEQQFPKLIFSPFVSTQAIVEYNKKMAGGVIFGVDSKKEALVNSIYADALINIDLTTYDVILGDGIKGNIGAFENDRVTLYFTNITPTGFSMMPKIKRFDVASSFKSGLNAYDHSYMYTSIEALSNILGRDSNVYDGLHIYSSKPFEDIDILKAELPYNVGIVGWWQQNGNFFAAMELEKRALFIVLMLIILIASLNIISSLLMTVMSRRKEIALLLSMGVSQKEIKSIFLRLGMIIGVSGICIGLIFGFSSMYLLDTFDIIALPVDVYGTSKLPLELALSDFLMILFGSFFIVYLASLYPASKATKIDVLEVLRNE